MGNHLVNGMPESPEVGDVYFDLSDGKVKIPGTEEVHEFGGGVQTPSFEPRWYGTVTSSGVATKLGGKDTLQCAKESTGRYRFYRTLGSIPSSAVIVTPLMKTTSTSVTPAAHYPVVLVHALQGITVCMYANSGGLSDYAFSILIL